MAFLLFDGDFVNTTDNIWPAVNRGVYYGDGIFETLRYQNGRILWVNDHLDRLKKGMSVLRMKLPFNLDEKWMLAEVEKLKKKNKSGEHAKIRLQLVRNGSTGYTPNSDSNTSWVLSVEDLDNEHYTLNKNGNFISMCNEVVKPFDELSTLKTSSSLAFVLAGIYCQEQKYDDCLILNPSGNVTESVVGNVFIYRDKEFVTPPLDQGCINGVMRKNIIKLLHNKGEKCLELPIKQDDIMFAEEIFFTNAIKGLVWVGNYKDKSYDNTMSKKLIKWLNEEVAMQNGN